MYITLNSFNFPFFFSLIPVLIAAVAVAAIAAITALIWRGIGRRRRQRAEIEAENAFEMQTEVSINYLSCGIKYLF